MSASVIIDCIDSVSYLMIEEDYDEIIKYLEELKEVAIAEEEQCR